MRAGTHDGPEHTALQAEAGYIDARPYLPDRRKPLATHGRTIHMGQSRHSERGLATSGLPWTTDIIRASRHVSNVPGRDMRGSDVIASSRLFGSGTSLFSFQ